jgi:hypothetical protein
MFGKTKNISQYCVYFLTGLANWWMLMLLITMGRIVELFYLIIVFLIFSLASCVALFLPKIAAILTLTFSVMIQLGYWFYAQNVFDSIGGIGLKILTLGLWPCIPNGASIFIAIQVLMKYRDQPWSFRGDELGPILKTVLIAIPIAFFLWWRLGW